MTHLPSTPSSGAQPANGNDMHPFDQLRSIIAQLRDPTHGCPWDKEQTHESLKRYLIEEAYEVLDAIDDRNADELCKELGDVLLQVVLHSQLADEIGSFSAIDVVQALSTKLIERHPHVFNREQAKAINTSAEVTSQWEVIKEQEAITKAKGSEKVSALAGVPKSMPALLRAQRVSEKAARLGFEWPTIGEIQEQILDEVREFVSAAASKDQAAIVDEFGDVFFALVQLARRLNIDAEDALQQSTSKFTKRFELVETRAKAPLSTLSLDEMQQLWVEAKAILLKKGE